MLGLSFLPYKRFLMSDFSPIRAALSCLPFVGGPILGTYNLWEVDSDIDAVCEEMKSSNRRLGELNDRISGLRCKVATARISPDAASSEVQALRGGAEGEIVPTNLKIISIKNNLTAYSACAIAGDLLTLSLLVSSVALGFFSLAPEILVGLLTVPICDIIFKGIYWFTMGSELQPVDS